MSAASETRSRRLCSKTGCSGCAYPVRKNAKYRPWNFEARHIAVPADAEQNALQRAERAALALRARHAHDRTRRSPQPARDVQHVEVWTRGRGRRLPVIEIPRLEDRHVEASPVVCHECGARLDAVANRGQLCTLERVARQSCYCRT